MKNHPAHQHYHHQHQHHHPNHHKPPQAPQHNTTNKHDQSHIEVCVSRYTSHAWLWCRVFSHEVVISTACTLPTTFRSTEAISAMSRTAKSTCIAGVWSWMLCRRHHETIHHHPHRPLYQWCFSYCRCCGGSSKVMGIRRASAVVINPRVHQRRRRPNITTRMHNVKREARVQISMILLLL